MKYCLSTIFAILSLLPLGAFAQEGTTDSTPTATTETEKKADTEKKSEPEKKAEPAKAEESSLGLNAELQVSSAYVFRGLNVFQKTSQMNQNMLLAPGVTWSVFETGITIGYWGAYQLTGDNRSLNTDVGLNLEQDLYVTYERKI
ncbi:hypothetical protein KJ865_00110, partial [Myxococcota bacterium]|nr:hypothetical protein [Myxococcota bacterium]